MNSSRSIRHPASAPAWVLAGLWLCTVSSSAAADQRVVLTGDEVAIYNLAGSLTVEPAKDGPIVVEVHPAGRDAAKLQVESGPILGSQSLRVRYPDSHIVYPGMGAFSSTTLSVAPDGRFGSAIHKLNGTRRVEIRSGGGGLEAHADLHVLVPPGKHVDFIVGAGSATVTRVTGDLSIEMDNGPVTIERTSGPLSVHAGSGALRVTDVEGDVVLDTGSGKIGFSGIHGRELAIDSGSGAVTGVDVTVDELSADTGSGALRIDNLRADRINIDNGSGNVDLDLQSDVSTLEVDSGSGDVTVMCPKALGASFDIDCGSGKIEIEPPHEIVDKSSGLVRGRIGDGRGRIHVDSGSGSVRFLRKSPVGSRLGHGAGRFFGYPFE